MRFARSVGPTFKIPHHLWRFASRRPLLTSLLILATAIAGMVLWAIFLPSPETHAAYTVAKSLRFNDDDSFLVT